MADKGSVTGKIAHYIRKNIRNGNNTGSKRNFISLERPLHNNCTANLEFCILLPCSGVIFI